MKKIIFIILLFTTYSFSQENRIVRQNELSDSLDALRGLIGTGGVALPDSTVFTSELAPYVDKSSAQTITGQKNFSGTVKFRSDSSITVGGSVGSYPLGLSFDLRTADSYQVPLKFNVIDEYTAAWTITNGEVDFAPSVDGKDHVLNIGYNWGADLLNHPQFGQQMEATYEMTDTTLVAEWFSYYNSKSATPTYSVRPFQLGTFRYGSAEPYRYTSSITTNADLIAINDEANRSLIEFRTQTYGATSDYSTKSYGALQNAFGNSMMYIVDSLWIFHNINNMGWLYQANSTGSAKELMRIDANDRLALAPSTNTPIDFQSPVYGSIYWADESGLGEVPIYKESGADRIFIGGSDGMVTNELEVTNIPQDTTGLDAGQFYIDDLTGSVQYTIPENILPEGSFTTWTGILKQQMPNGFYGTFDTLHAYVEQVPSGKLHYVNDGTDLGGLLSTDSSEIGATYGYSFVVSQIIDTVRLYITDESAELISATGFYSGTSDVVTIRRNFINLQGSDDGSAAEVTLDDVRIWEIGGNITAPTYDVPVILDSLGSEIALIEAGDFDTTYIYEVTDSLAEDIADLALSAPVWGSISGTLTNQADLQNALDAKLDSSFHTMLDELLSPSGTDKLIVDDSGTLKFTAIEDMPVPSATRVVLDSLAADIADIADSNFVLTSETSNWDKTESDDIVWSDTVSTIATQYDLTQIEVGADSSVINDLIATYLDTVSSDTSDYTLDVIDKVVKNSMIQNYEIKNVTTADEFTIFWTDDTIVIDSIQCESDDSVTIQIDLSGTETNVFSSAQLINGTTTLSTFAEDNITDKATLQFTQVGDNLGYLRLRIYWSFL